MSHERATKVIDNLEYIFEAEVWDDKCVQYWKDFTFVDSSFLLNYTSKDNFHICYKKAKLTDCLSYIKKYTTKKIKEIENVLSKKSSHIYGDASLYDKTESPLTYKQVYKQLLKLMNTLNLVDNYKCR